MLFFENFPRGLPYISPAPATDMEDPNRPNSFYLGEVSSSKLEPLFPGATDSTGSLDGEAL
jgi:hypothetical protein